jgi:hypothetical protein
MRAGFSLLGCSAGMVADFVGAIRHLLSQPHSARGHTITDPRHPSRIGVRHMIGGVAS